MNRSLIALWLSLLVAIVTMAALAQFWIQQRERSSQQRVREILQTRLSPFDQTIARVIDSYALVWQRETDGCDLGDLSTCVELTRNPLVGALVVVNEEQQLVFPQNVSTATKDRQSLVDEAQQLLREMADPRPKRQSSQSSLAQAEWATSTAETPQLLNARSYTSGPRFSQSGQSGQSASLPLTPPAAAQSQASRPPASQRGAETGESQAPFDSVAPLPEPIETGNAAGLENEVAVFDDEAAGWITWYHRRGMVLGYWWRQRNAGSALITIPRGRWMADLVAALPDSQSLGRTARDAAAAATPAGALYQLIDVEGNLIYQWSDVGLDGWSPQELNEADAILPVTPPLEGWRLRLFATSELRRSLAGDNIVAPLWLAVFGISATLLLAGALVTINLNRQVRLASQRVSFVNQVSHELRTPLTNICMYADLLAESLEHDPEASSGDLQRVGVIRNESQRLSRLIGNVLQFAKRDQQPAGFRLGPAVLDELVRDVVDMFRPRLAELGFEIQLALGASDKRSLDADAVEQILVNLISNVEKYAASGRLLQIKTISLDEAVQIRVLDAGPGVPSRWAEKVFQPFMRAHDRLQDPAGTGIGLTIARDLARLHGGDCHLAQSAQGALFVCDLKAPRVVDGADD